MSAGSRLDVATPSPTEIVVTRGFAAPRARVFDALTVPDLLVRWYGARGWRVVECDVDLRPGGAWRFVSSGPGGQRMVQSGTYLEVRRPHRLVHTEVFDGSTDEPALVTIVLTERAGQTILRMTVRYPRAEARDAMLETRMASGLREAYDRLAEVLSGPGGGGPTRRQPAEASTRPDRPRQTR